MTNTLRVPLGPADGFTTLPARITIGSHVWFLVHDGFEFRLLSSVCPHQGGAVYDEGTRFECPQHGWRFDRTTGRCFNAPRHGLTAFPVAIEDGVLFAQVPRHADGDEGRSVRVAKPGLTIELHAHACLEIAYRGFALVTDPWLDGPAFLGAWAPYPPHDARGAGLRPSAVLLTHEHSDHFHEPTLRFLNRHTPIYVPDFPNQRMPQRLAALGFRTVRLLRFGLTTTIADRWRVTAFEPVSYWNDALILVDIDGFQLLNINDAGINAHIARNLSPVDVLTVQFSGGASGYPWTWAHLTDDEKIDISARECAGKLKMISEAATVYRARAVLPFASHFTLWHPEHRRYAGMIKRNTLADVKGSLAGSGVTVIDLLPGDRWDGGTDVIERGANRADGLYDPQRMEAYMNTAVSAAAFDAVHPSDQRLSHAELTDYLLRLNEVPEIGHCEDLTVHICATVSTRDGERLDVSFAVASSHLHILPEPAERPNVTVEIPLAVLTAIVREGLSWDEAFIGFWCRFDRHPNVYHAGFWRLLQAPYYRRSVDERSAGGSIISPASTVADVLEVHGEPADRILRRYGLYCCGCHHSTSDSIAMAARQHGIDVRRMNLLIEELNRACSGSVMARI